MAPAVLLCAALSVDQDRRLALEYKGQRFHTTSLRSGLRRLVHPDLYARSRSEKEIKSS
jgi:hypothetical protein